MTSKSQWQGNEKDTAKTFNTKRNPFSGSNGGLSASDSLHPNLFIESKVKEKHSIMSLYRDTLQKAELEGKIPLLTIKETDSNEVLYCFEKNHLFQIVQEIDLHVINDKLPVGTTIDKLLQCQSNSQMSLYEITSELEQTISIIFRSKVLSKKNKELLKAYSILLYYIDTIREYLNDKPQEMDNVDLEEENQEVVPEELLDIISGKENED